MSDEIYPRTRFHDAGATDAELDQLNAEFDRSDIAVKSSMTTYFAGVSEGGLRQYLDILREAEHFDHKSSETEKETEAESLAAVADPVPVSGAPADVGETQDAPKNSKDTPSIL